MNTVAVMMVATRGLTEIRSSPALSNTTLMSTMANAIEKACNGRRQFRNNLFIISFLSKTSFVVVPKLAARSHYRVFSPIKSLGT